MNAFRTYFLDVLKTQYVNFEGRATRQQYWMYTLFNVLITLVLSLCGSMDNILGTLFTVLYYLFSLAVLLPSLAIGVRRLHDTNRTGWWLLLALLPVIGPVVLLVFFVLPSTPGQNRFGAGK